MALIFRGTTCCPLCGGVIGHGDPIVGFPAFLDPGHRLWPFDDSAMHAGCFEGWPDRHELLRLHREHKARRRRTVLTARRENHGRIEEALVRAQAIEAMVHDAEHARAMELVAQLGGECPSCGVTSKGYRVLSGARKRVVCPACARSCNAFDLRRPTM